MLENARHGALGFSRYRGGAPLDRLVQNVEDMGRSDLTYLQLADRREDLALDAFDLAILDGIDALPDQLPRRLALLSLASPSVMLG